MFLPLPRTMGLRPVTNSASAAAHAAAALAFSRAVPEAWALTDASFSEACLAFCASLDAEDALVSAASTHARHCFPAPFLS